MHHILADGKDISWHYFVDASFLMGYDDHDDNDGDANDASNDVDP
jgi:hypothetical protein